MWGQEQRKTMKHCQLHAMNCAPIIANHIQSLHILMCTPMRFLKSQQAGRRSTRSRTPSYPHTLRDTASGSRSPNRATTSCTAVTLERVSLPPTESIRGGVEPFTCSSGRSGISIMWPLIRPKLHLPPANSGTGGLRRNPYCSIPRKGDRLHVCNCFPVASFKQCDGIFELEMHVSRLLWPRIMAYNLDISIISLGKRSFKARIYPVKTRMRVLPKLDFFFFRGLYTVKSSEYFPRILYIHTSSRWGQLP